LIRFSFPPFAKAESPCEGGKPFKCSTVFGSAFHHLAGLAHLQGVVESGSNSGSKHSYKRACKLPLRAFQVNDVQKNTVSLLAEAWLHDEGLCGSISYQKKKWRVATMKRIFAFFV
jgi:hypothetical protein